MAGLHLTGNRFARLLLLIALRAIPALAQTDEVSVASPNGEIEFRIAMRYPPGDEANYDFPSYQIDYHGQRLIDTSFIAFGLYSQRPLGGKLAVIGESRESVDENYTLFAGKANTVRNHYNSVVIDYLQNGSQGRKLQIEVRAYDEGIAFRSIIPDTQLTHEVLLESELTQFNFAKDGEAYPLILDNYQTGYEDQYHRMTLSGIHADQTIALPFLVEQPGIGWVAITEANVDNFPGGYLWHQEGTMMAMDLAPLLDGTDFVLQAEAPVTTPWRVLMIGDTPLELIESNIVTSLAEPSLIEDVSWIRPGKALRTGWNEPAAGVTTGSLQAAIDFAGDSGFEYVLIDAGWAAPGPGGVPDLTATVAEIDMPAVLQHAAANNVGIWLGADWRSVDAQIDEVFPLLEQWGVAGIQIDAMNRDDQGMVNWYRRVAQSAAEHHLMVSLHEAFKPDGLRRTWPNVLTREAVMGLDYAKQGARVTPQHDVMLAFTRMLAGPLDYSPGGFRQVPRDEFAPRDQNPMVLGTRAHQLALYVVLESPLVTVPDSPESYTATPEDEADFAFIQTVPATWDETRAIAGRIGEYVTMARRSGDDWYLGVITGDNSRTIDVPLDFLGSGEFVAEIWADAENADVNPKATRVESRQVFASSILTLDLAPGGGAAVRLRPAAR